MNPGVDQSARAEALHEVLQRRFWSGRQRLYRVTESRPLNPFGPWHHWWQSHALGTLLDRYDRTGDPGTRKQAEALVAGMRARNRGVLVNDFYDDMGWLALELLRLPGHEEDLDVLLRTIRQGQMPTGGIAWAVPHPEFRNTPATGPAAILALRLGQRTGDEQLVEWGLTLVRWLEEVLHTGAGDVPDGFRVHGDGTTSIDAARYSYNYGLVVGAELAAYAVTRESAHLDRARLVAWGAVREFSDSDGIWRSEGGEDRAIFRGILARYLADLALVLDDGELAPVLHRQADAVWAACRGGAVGAAWPAPTHGRVDLAEHVGGLLVVEAAARTPLQA